MRDVYKRQDLDGVGMPQLRDTLHQMNKDILPQMCIRDRIYAALRAQ